MIYSVELKLAALAVAVMLGAYGAYTLPEKYREEGRRQERAVYREVSDGAVVKREIEFLEVKAKLAEERANREKDRTESDKKFAQYIIDVRAGRVAGFNGLRVAKSDLCAPRAEETTGTARAEDQTSARLPRDLEENLFRFAHNRDEIIADFEAFKNEVRVAGCFKTEPKN